MPSRSGTYGLVRSVGRCWPDYHRVQIPTISTHTFNGSYHRALNMRVFVAALIILANNFDRVKLGKYYASLVHIIHILQKHSRIIKYFSNHLKPIYNLIIYVIAVLVKGAALTRLEFWMAFIKELRLVPSRKLA